MWVPLKQTVIVRPVIGNDPDWNTPIYGDDYALNCRFQESMRLVRNRYGEEVVSVGTFYFDRFPPISINDTLTYTNEHAQTTTYPIIAIAVKRWINGKPVLTEVSV